MEGTGWTPAMNVISNEARLALGSLGSVTVAFHFPLSLPLHLVELLA